MLKSLYTGVAGLRSQQTRMDVTANNIANVSIKQKTFEN